MSCTVTLESDAGWLTIRLVLDEAPYTLVASSLSHPLENLLEAVAAILRGGAIARAVFADEPGEYRLVLQNLGNGRLGLTVLEFPAWPSHQSDQSGTPVFEGETRLRTFAGAVADAAQKILDELGPEGYETEWHEPFPERALSGLRALLNTGVGS